MPIRNLQLTSAQISKVGCKQIIDITDQLPVNKNYTWEQLTGIRDINDITTIALHHDCYPKKNVAAYTDLQLAQDIARDHIALTKNETGGDPGFPYHFWIRNGQAYQCNDLLDRTYGVGSNNAYIVNVCVSGDYFSYDTLTDADRAALYGVIIACIGVMPNYKEIKGHKEFPYNNTDCPGYDQNKVKVDIQSLQMQLKAESDPAKIMDNCYRATNQHVWLFNQYKKDPVANEWLEPKLLQLFEWMDELDMFFNK